MSDEQVVRPPGTGEGAEHELPGSLEGLTTEEAQRRLTEYGPNALEEKKRSVLRQLAGYFWGPIPWMIEVAAVLSAVVGHWTDLAIILVMLVFNAAVGFFQERQAADALAALQGELALRARVRRDGEWRGVPAADLVPGDVVRLRLGDVVPADVALAGAGFLSADESALTGESLPVDKQAGDTAWSGSVAKRGDMMAVVTATGGGTRFARTAKLVEGAGAVSHFQRAVLTIGDFLVYISLGLAAVLVLAQLARGDSFLEVFQFVLILVVAAIPVAMPAVLSVTMALGALKLSRMKAIVARLQSVEELAGVDVLCSDKTGTLTENRLTLGEPVPMDGAAADELLLAGALACDEGNDDPIDLAVLGALDDPGRRAGFRRTDLVPFDPVSKRAEASYVGPDGDPLRVTKGAPQVIFDLCGVRGADRGEAEEQVAELARRGFRTLGVARADVPGGGWRLLGVLPLFDPPRADSAETIRRAREHGIAVKMVTGDNLAIGGEIAGQLGLGTDLLAADQLFTAEDGGERLRPGVDAATIEAADGFAQVFPEHKYAIVKALQERGHLVAMTGDGVNDAPALKQAEVGVAVSGATSAARAAAALVLTAPGLEVIIGAVEEARRIFERMSSYAVYRITETVRIMIFVVLAMVVFNFYPISTVMIILLALLNDLPILTIAYDNTLLDPRPVRWDMRRVLILATVLGVIGVVETFGMLLIGKLLLHLSLPELQSLIYLKLAVAGHLTLLVVRTRGSWLARPFPAPVLLGAVLVTQALAVAIVGFGLLVAPIPWFTVGLVWGYCLVWAFIEDLAKRHVGHLLRLSGRHHHRFLDRVQGALGGTRA